MNERSSEQVKSNSGAAQEHVSRNTAAGVGTEYQEPGQPTRHIEKQHGPESDVEQIARQQGTTQRGYTADRKGNEHLPSKLDDTGHRGRKPSADPHR